MPAVIRRMSRTGPRIGVQPIAEFDHLPGAGAGDGAQHAVDERRFRGCRHQGSG
jgi:hypothetical protein